MSWRDELFVAYDCETTGTDIENDRIVTASLVWIKGAQIEARSWLVNPGIEIPQGAIDVHGVTNERAKAEGVHPATGSAQILADLDEAWTGGRPVVIFNAPFDLSILDRELRRHCGQSLDGIVGPVIDPMCIDRALDPYRKGKRTLAACCEHYQVSLTDAHTAEGDAIATARLAWRLAQVYPGQLADLALVNGLQAGWRADWATNFRDYLTRQGKPADDVRGDWPLVPMEASA